GRRKAHAPKAARLRVEGLEARELLTAYPLAFDLNAAQSTLTLSGKVYGSFGADIAPQGQGSGALLTHYSGTLNSMYHPTAKNLQFLLSGSTLGAANSGSWAPTVGGNNGTQPANYGGHVEKDIIMPVEEGYLALRDIGGGLANASPVSVAGGDIAPAE